MHPLDGIDGWIDWFVFLLYKWISNNEKEKKETHKRATLSWKELLMVNKMIQRVWGEKWVENNTKQQRHSWYWFDVEFFMLFTTDCWHCSYFIIYLAHRWNCTHCFALDLPDWCLCTNIVLHTTLPLTIVSYSHHLDTSISKMFAQTAHTMNGMVHFNSWTEKV